MLRTSTALVIAAFMALGLNSVSWAQSSDKEISALPQPTEQEIKNQCALIGNLTFLAIEKFKKGRELDQAKDELSRVAETAFNKEEFAAFSDQLRERYNAAVLDAFLQDRSDPKTAAQEQIKDCIRRNL
jgi:hypothetical protein